MRYATNGSIVDQVSWRFIDQITIQSNDSTEPSSTDLRTIECYPERT